MDKKTLISITGTTCVGKSTLLKAIRNVCNDVFIIPQITTRQARSDDDPRLMKYTRIFDKDKMFLHNKELSYGIEQEAINNFLQSDKPFAVSINGTDEIEMLKSKSQELLYKNVLLTFAEDYNSEIGMLSGQLKLMFDKENYQKRMAFYSQHIKDKLLNTDFISENIDLHLTRTMPLSSWSLEMAKILQANPSKLYVSLCREIGTQSRVKRYVCARTDVRTKRILSFLKCNKR